MKITMEGFRRGEFAVDPKNLAEFDALMKVLDEQGMRWNDGSRATVWGRDLKEWNGIGASPSQSITHSHIGLPRVSVPAFLAAIAPKRDMKIVITARGPVTTARLMDGKRTVRTAEAKCSPDDDYDFETGARIAFGGLMPPTAGPAIFGPDTPKPKRYTVDDFLNRRVKITVAAKDRPALERLCEAHGIGDCDLEFRVAERNGFTRPFYCTNLARKTALFTDWIGIKLPVISFRDLEGVKKYFKEGK